MTVSAPTRLAPRRSLRREPFAQQVLMVEFTSSDGRTWQAIGGGDTLADAVAFARDSCPADGCWQPIRWNGLYGD